MRVFLFLLLFTARAYGQEKVFDIRQYGAKGDGVTIDTRSIDDAIAACAKAGGGTVVVPSGTFVTGSFRLYSNMNLYLSPGAVLLGSPRMEDYLIQKDYGFTGYGAGNKLGIVFADHATNVSVTGTGTIDGNPAASLYMDSLQVSNPSDWKYTRQGQNYLSGASRDEAPVMWKGVYGDRPGVELLFSSCQKVTIRDITIRNAADWSMNLLNCDDAKVLGISIHNNLSVPNSDGIDMYGSKNVVISDCNIRAGDDAIAVISTSNLVVTNCNLTSRSSGIRIGYNAFDDDDSGNLLFDNIRISGSNRGIGIFQRRGGNLSNMLFSHMIIDTRLYPGQWWGHGEPIHISAIPGIGSKIVGRISNVRFEDIVASGDEGVLLYGSPESNLSDIHLTNVQVTLRRGPLTLTEGGNFDLRPTNDPALNLFSHDIPALYAQYVNGLSLENVSVRWGDSLPSFFTHTIECKHFTDLTVRGLSGALIDTPVSVHYNGYGATASPFVTTDGITFQLEGKPYYYIGTNYWYGSLIAAGAPSTNAPSKNTAEAPLNHRPGAPASESAGRRRVREELDFLVSQGVTNLRVLAGAEGSGMLNGRERVGPPLQPQEGVFDERVFRGLDYLLSEMGKRHMKAILYLSNNWEWSGGFLQYLDWHGQVDDKTVRAKMPYDNFRDDVSRFYACKPCTDGYAAQSKALIERVNIYTRLRYSDDPTIMAWELGNEPRPMRAASNDAYRAWVASAAAYIKSLDPHHLVTVGTEGVASTEDLQLYEDIHADPHVDYLTVHIWPKNFGFFSDTAIAAGWNHILGSAEAYLQQHIPIAERLHKPMVIEEFGLPRDLQSFVPGSPVRLRDAWYAFIFEHCARIPVLAGCNFWAFGGQARPIPGQVFWKKGDTWMGDPPGEEQGLNTVFDCDSSTWKVVREWRGRIQEVKRDN